MILLVSLKRLLNRAGARCWAGYSSHGRDAHATRSSDAARKTNRGGERSASLGQCWRQRGRRRLSRRRALSIGVRGAALVLVFQHVTDFGPNEVEEVSQHPAHRAAADRAAAG